MKINGLGPQDIYKSYMQNTPRADDETVSTAPEDTTADRVEISPECAQLGEARGLVRKSGVSDGSDTDRSEKLSSLKQRIESGTYNVSSEDIARSILTGRLYDGMA